MRTGTEMMDGDKGGDQMIKFCPKCGTMHDSKTTLCSSCFKKQKKIEANSSSVLKRNKEKYARFEGGAWVG